MQEYEIRKGMSDNLALDRLKATMHEIFGAVEEKDGKLVSSFGALRPLMAWPDKKSLCVDTQMARDVSDEEAMKTIKAYNVFLERVTGYTAKERGKRAQKKAKSGKL